MKKVILAVVFSLTIALGACAGSLDFVEVAAPEINCIFDLDCTIAVTDTVDQFTFPAANGEGFIQTRTFPVGEAGTAAAGLYAYLYRIDLTQVTGITANPCITTVTIPFGPIEQLDYDGDGTPEHAFVISGGEVGSVAPASINQNSRFDVTHQFAPAICGGSRPGAGDSTYFIGLVGGGPPLSNVAQLAGTLDFAVDREVRVPSPSGDEPLPARPTP